MPARVMGDPAGLYRLRRRLFIAVAALGVVTAVGVVGYLIIGGDEYGLVDAIYMTLITLTTVGFGEVIDLSNNPAGRAFTIFLLLGGLSVVLYAVPLMGAFVIEGELFHAFARARMEKAIGQMTGHYLVVGDTAAAGYVTDELRKTKRQVVFVVPKADEAGELLNGLGDIPHLVGDPTDDDTLRDAGVDRAGGVVASMDSDNDNILVVLTARRLAPHARIVAATERVATEAKLRAAGADAVVSPSRIGGMRMASELVRPHVVTFLDRMVRDDARSLRVEELTVPSDATAVGKTLKALKVDNVKGAVLLAVRRAGTGDYEFRPPPDTAVEAEMTLVFMADADGREQLDRSLRQRRSFVGSG